MATFPYYGRWPETNGRLESFSQATDTLDVEVRRQVAAWLFQFSVTDGVAVQQYISEVQQRNIISEPSTGEEIRAYEVARNLIELSERGADWDAAVTRWLDELLAIGPNPPPTELRTFLFPFTTDGVEVISGVPVNHQHASPQTEILDGELVTYAADVPVISDFGVTGRAQNVNRHGYSANVTEIGTGGANYQSPKWNEPQGVDLSFDGTKGTILQDATTGGHFLKMARVLGSTLDNVDFIRYIVMMELQPVGGQRYVGLTTNLNDEMIVDLQNGTFTGATFGGYVEALDNGWFFIYHVARIQGAGAANRETIRLLDDNQNPNYAGDITKGVNVRSASYGNKQLFNQYSPIVNDTGAALTRLATTQIYGQVPVATTDTGFSLYCELTNTAIPDTSDGDILVLNYYTDAVFGGGSSPSAGWILILSNIGGQLNLSWVNAVGCSEGAGVPISAWPVNETRRVLFELDGTVPSIQVDGSNGVVTSVPVPVPPSGLGFYGHLVDASALGEPTAYVAPKYVMRIDQVGLTLEQAAIEARKPV